ncbi:histidine N-alpha-methyltransferase-like, partial [Pecten maximus]|uniref:histidine N-alpha-methyltransferase-like n=1 Tax=Pecten maximus TaxID=6579 RepID=UPI001458BBFA
MANGRKQSLVTGLTSSRKYIPTWYNYDKIGSELNLTAVTKNVGYYLTKSQISILEKDIEDIIPRVPYDFTLVDLGSGDCSKTRYVIDELLKRQQNLSFFPVDISREFLLNSTKKLREEYDDSLVVTPIGADYQQGVEQLKQFKGPKLILWIGSMICLPYDVQVNTLRMVSTIMTDKCRLVFTGDITQDRDAILKAYHDDEGLMQCFVEYAIIRLNKEEGSKIDLNKFKYEMDFISDQNPHHMSYVVTYLEAKEAVNYPI